MELDRFHEARWYRGRTPLKELSFVVHVWRALIQDEGNKELVCRQRVAWDDKVQSPKEKIQALQQFLAFQAQQAAVLQRNDAAGGSGAQQLPVEALLEQVRAVPGCSNITEQLNAFFSVGPNMFFTHPAAADFINTEEERSPVEPMQPVTPLTQAMLRRHQREHQPSKTMYLMLSLGHVATLRNLADPNNLHSAVWQGRDLVICSLTSVEEDTAFIAKPCLQETHTLLVDGRMIWTFLVEVFEGTVAAPATSHGRPEIAATLKRVSSSVSSSVDHAVFASRDESERRELLRQVVSRRRSGGPSSSSAAGRLDGEASVRAGTALKSRHEAKNESRAPFTSEPPYGLGRFHYLCNIEKCVGIAAGSVRAKLTVFLPDGCRPDVDENAKAGVVHAEEIISQLAYSALINDWKSSAPQVLHVFNEPFELHCLQSPINEAPIRLAVTLVTQGPGGDSAEQPVGYGSVTLPNLPGSHSLEVPLWRPKPTGREFLRSFFNGGGPCLVDPFDILHQPVHGGVSSKTGLYAESVGALKVHCMTMVQVWTETASNPSDHLGPAAPAQLQSLSRRLSRVEMPTRMPK
jgi:hypothetical protein